MAGEQYDSESQSSALLLLPKELPSRASWRDFLRAEVDPDHATAPLAAFCFMTGFIDAISFTAIFVWCGFQTGNFAQLALAAARMYRAQTIDISISDLQALVSLLAFNLGAFFGRLGDRMGAHTRGWLISGTVTQAVLTLAAGICIQESKQDSIAIVRGEPSWTNTLTFIGLALMAASLGLQGIMAKRLNTQFSTTVVLTAVWIELMTDPHLFYRRKIVSRDHNRRMQHRLTRSLRHLRSQIMAPLREAHMRRVGSKMVDESCSALYILAGEAAAKRDSGDAKHIH
ncbi:hypothetical protein K438DRAFT_8975 [Mycena galopus ATCC 62051]|nr:hypothetical protein K438DRAFT_8975 [Mycena galopus ATCC 62051]